MYPSSFKTSAIADLILEAGISTAAWRAWSPFRMRVSISAIGSVIMARALLLPARLRHARNLAFESELAEADPAQPELAHIGAGTAAPLAAAVLPHRVGLIEGARVLRLHDHRDFRHYRSPPTRSRRAVGSAWPGDLTPRPPLRAGEGVGG